MQTHQTDPLEAWVDDSIQLVEAKGYRPSEFIAMRERYGTAPAMERLMRSGTVQSGFIRLKKLGMIEWSVEAGILKFRERFTEPACDAAAWRLDHIDDPELR